MLRLNTFKKEICCDSNYKMALKGLPAPGGNSQKNEPFSKGQVISAQRLVFGKEKD